MKEKTPVLVLDYSTIKTIVEGKKKSSKDMMIKIDEMKKKYSTVICLTTLINFRKGLYEATNIDLEMLRKLIELVEIVKTECNDLKDENKIIEDTVEFANRVFTGNKMV